MVFVLVEIGLSFFNTLNFFFTCIFAVCCFEWKALLTWVSSPGLLAEQLARSHWVASGVQQCLPPPILRLPPLPPPSPAHWSAAWSCTFLPGCCFFSLLPPSKPPFFLLLPLFFLLSLPVSPPPPIPTGLPPDCRRHLHLQLLSLDTGLGAWHWAPSPEGTIWRWLRPCSSCRPTAFSSSSSMAWAPPAKTLTVRRCPNHAGWAGEETSSTQVGEPNKEDSSCQQELFYRIAFN